MRVSVGGELLSDLIGEHVDLLDQSLEGAHQGPSDVDVCGPSSPGGAARCGAQTGVHGGRVGAAWVTHRRQPCAAALGGHPVGVVLAGHELQTDRRIQMPEQSDRPGEDAFEVLPQLLSARRLLNCPARSSSTRWNNSKQSSLRTSDRVLLDNFAI